ncbi:hypothetical protein XENTR_v10007061 [Xenopus tropicalis]|nr:hypothetical protein XENTR_v10007061 [Xenopus tropicalis]
MKTFSGGANKSYNWLFGSPMLTGSLQKALFGSYTGFLCNQNLPLVMSESAPFCFTNKFANLSKDSRNGEKICETAKMSVEIFFCLRQFL